MTDIVSYPATYQVPIFRRIISTSHAAILLLLSLFGRAHLDENSSKLILALSFIIFLLIVIFSLNNSSAQVTLCAEQIEKKSWLSTKVWRRDEAVGVWYGLSGGFRLVHKHNRSDYFVIPSGIKRDATWIDWLRDVPDMSKISEAAKGKTLVTTIICTGFGAVALMMAFLSFSDFKDSFIVRTGIQLRAQISTVQNGRTGAMGWVNYTLPNGTGCHDWTELAPAGSVRPGDDITVAVDGACGHPISGKKPLHPWYYLTIAVGIIIAMVYQLMKLNNFSFRNKNMKSLHR